jgi:DNA-binding transcriptional LysR family regulator
LRAIEAFRAGSVEFPRRTVFAISLQLQIGLLATGQYLTMFPQSVMHYSARRFSIRALPLELPLPPIETGIIVLKNRTLSPAARLFIECSRGVAKSLAKAS